MLPLKAANMLGVEALSTLFSPASMTAGAGAPPPPDLPDAALATLVSEILQAEHGLVMCMGKGGVGKTTIAAAIAVALAQAGREVHLTTTDPAAHLTGTLHGTVAGLQVSRIDPVAAVQAYRDHVMATKGKDLDEAGRAVLAEDLLSPCTEETAVFQQFSRVLSESRRRFVIVDTAPTGHTLLLLDATGSYHREVARHMAGSMNFTTPLMRLQDPAQTKVILVTLAETTPVLEAQDLQEDLERAGIHPWAWVINNSVSAARPEAPFLRQRAASEAGPIQQVSALADRIALVPLRAAEPTGEKNLAALADLTRQPA